MNNMKINAIIDTQFGSTGKGLLAGFLALNRMPDTVVTAWGPNAGHTFIDAEGRKYVHTMLANGVVSPALERIMMGPGSVINLDNLYHEIMSCEDHIYSKSRYSVKVFIHENATVVTEEHRRYEKLNINGIGSTGKGNGAAIIAKINRSIDKKVILRDFSRNHPVFQLVHVLSPSEYQKELGKAGYIQIEGAQGASLSIHSQFYPYCTSRDVSVSQMLADCAMPITPYTEFLVTGTARTYPIRVANRYDERGNMTQSSGPCYGDQEETTFEAIGQEVELTTVTQLPRRIFTYSKQQVNEAIMYNGITEMFLNFCNYASRDTIAGIIAGIEGETFARVKWLGYGPSVIEITGTVREAGEDD